METMQGYKPCLEEVMGCCCLGRARSLGVCLRAGHPNYADFALRDEVPRVGALAVESHASARPD